MEKNNLARRILDVENVMKTEYARLKYGPSSEDNKLDVENVTWSEDIMKREYVRLKHGPGSSNFYRNMGRDVENVTGSEDKKKTEHAPLSNHVSYRNKYFENVSSSKDKKRADAWFKDGPGSPDFYRNMTKYAMAQAAQRSKARKTRLPVEVVAIKTLLLRFKRRQSKQKKPMFKKDVENVTGSEDKKKTEDAPLKDAVSFRNRDVENGTDSDTTSKDEEWNYHLAKKKREDTHLKDVFSDV